MAGDEREACSLSIGAAFKYYKQRARDPDVEMVVDFDSGHHPGIPLPLVADEQVVVAGNELLPVSAWRAYALPGHPGFVFLRNPFTDGGQRAWMRRTVRDYPVPGNVTNLDATRPGAHGASTLWAECSRRGDLDALRHLRWATLGYHYNWTDKVYTDAHHSPFPPELALLASTLVRALGAAVMPEPRGFEAQAAISNYYSAGDTLAPHTDHSERDLAAPLVSVSFGCSAIFLIGGCDREAPATPVWIRSGDVVVLSGPSRLAYHSVPRVVAGTAPPALQGDGLARMQAEMGAGEDAWTGQEHELLAAFLQAGRVNLNVRQVLPPHCPTLAAFDASEKHL